MSISGAVLKLTLLSTLLMLLLSEAGREHLRPAEARKRRLAGVPVAELQSTGEALLEDALLIAQLRGEPLERVLAALAHQARLDALLAEIGAQYGDVYAGAYTAGLGAPVSTIRIKGAVPAALAARVADEERMHLAGGAALSWSELTALGAEVALILEELGLQGVTTWIDVRAGRINARIPAGQMEESEIRRLVQNRISVRLPQAAAYVARGTLRLLEPGAVGKQVGEQAGGGLPALDDGWRECTTAYTVTLSDGRRGWVTAAHCAGLNGVLQVDGVVVRSVHVAEHVGLYGDLELHVPVGPPPSNGYHAGDASVRAVAAIASPWTINVGDWLCVYGRTSGRQCARLMSRWLCYHPDERLACGMVAMDAHVTDGGDSGGPWFLGDTAWGIHSGRTRIQGRYRSIWTPAYLIEEALGAAILH